MDGGHDGKTFAFPDTLFGTDSHTTMVNGMGVLGWGVGGIEAEAAMLGQPIAMLIPDVIGFRLLGRLPELHRSFWGIGYGADALLLSVGSQGEMRTLMDGALMWDVRATGATTQLNAVAYGNNRFVAVGMGGAILSQAWWRVPTFQA